MKFEADSLYCLKKSEYILNRLEEKFIEFQKELNSFASSSSPLKGVLIEPAADLKSVAVRYRTAAIILRLYLQFNGQNMPSARIEATIDKSTNCKDLGILGVVVFDAQGSIDLDPGNEQYRVHLIESAQVIVTHFLMLALKHNVSPLSNMAH
ncbi:hypothetical protein [Rhodoferax mekongensis]|uniref:Uncharacterized protein n=1 Tax=Rhodoferax mekongensis TaxID=3068341 RepID=A0ABZ0AWH8_9BURK|nr:hypothetical protein [Rhodoferax sp. TBRC 17307]WNO04005.1 hypothetical protein RAN89_13945 [Rhodoferax sp. TBRC 17307]